MCNAEIITIAEKIKNKEMSRFGEIYQAFAGLIHHYEIKLGYDDAEQELTVFLLELIYTLDTDRFLPDDSESLHRYIAASLRNKYIALSKRARRARRLSISFSCEFSLSVRSPRNTASAHPSAEKASSARFRRAYPAAWAESVA